MLQCTGCWLTDWTVYFVCVLRTSQKPNQRHILTFLMCIIADVLQNVCRNSTGTVAMVELESIVFGKLAAISH